MNRVLRYAAFVAGLAALGWVGLGYAGANPLASTVTALIAAFYLMGALDLRRFQQASAGLAQAVAETPDALPALAPWLERVPASLRGVVRRRIEGEPAGLPGPAMAPYLAGLLVLLGMLGTFLGMVLTLRGTGMALDSATDLVAVRTSLVAPVKGLGLAFGTSVAGVATSAALGLMSALCRRDRVQVAQALDARIATTLRVFSLAHQREESLRLAQRQAELMPVLVDRLQAMMATLERQSDESNARLLASQERFNDRAQAAYAGLAVSVDRGLQDSLAESARLAGATLRPVVEETMASVARETAALHDRLGNATQRQADALAARFESLTARVAESWQAALDRHGETSHGLAQTLHAALDRSAEAFERRSVALMDDVTRRHVDWSGEMATTMSAAARDAAAMHARVSDAVTTQLDGVSTRLDDTTRRVTQTWHEALAQHARVGDETSAKTSQALDSAAGTFAQHSAALLRTVETAHTALQSTAAARDEQRVATLSATIEAMAASLRREWQQAGAHTLEQQQRICETLERTAREITAQAETHAKSTVDEIGRLVQAASEAPRAAAEVIAALREKLSDSMARDNTLLEERGRMLETLGTLLDGVNQAATEQRGAIDALVTSSASVLERVGARFGEQVESGTGRLAAVAAQVTGSAVEVASLGEAFGFAVALFSQSSDKLGAQLQRIDASLGQSMARSDEQLAYYVAQAREVIDLSLLSQKQIIEDLQRLSPRPAASAKAPPNVAAVTER